MTTCFQFLRLRNLLAAVVVTTALCAHGQASPPQEVAIGQHAPSFMLTDQNDREVSLDGLLKKGPVAVVFVRSVEWCVYCQLQAMQLDSNLKEIQAGGGQVVVITYDSPDKVKRFAATRKISLPILSDANSKIIDAYAMRSVQGAADQVGSSQHGTFIVDVGGIIRSKPYLKSFEGHAAVEALASALKEAKNTEEKPSR